MLLCLFIYYLTNEYAAALETVGLDSYIGFCHKLRSGRVSLACDLVEETRSIVDRLVITMFNLKVLTEDDFEEQISGAVLLNEDGRKKVITKWQEKKRSEIVHPYLNQKIMFGLLPYVQSNLLSGTYPETSHFIPKDFAYIINLNMKEFYDAVDRASLLAQNKEKNIIKMHIQDKDMVITSTSNELGNAEEKLHIDCNNKEKIEISFSSKFMMDALKVIKEENILLLLNTDDKPILIKPVEDETLTESYFNL